MNEPNAEQQTQRALEQRILWLYSIFTAVMVAASVALGWEAWLAPLLVAGLLSGWVCVASQWRSYRFRAYWVSGLCLLNFLAYGCRSQYYFTMLISMAALFILLSLYGLPEIMGTAALLPIVLLVYHLFVRHSIVPPTTPRETYLMLLQVISLLTVEGLVYYFVGQQKKIRRRLSETIEDLKKAEKSKDDFLANVSHELRTPISTICGISDVLCMEELPGKVHEDVAHIHVAGQHLLAAVSDILDFTELQMGTLTLTEEPYDTASTLNDVMNMGMAKNQKGLELRLDCVGEIPASLLGDEQKLKRVMLNLIDNAIKFTEHGSVRVQVQARKETYGVNLCVCVKDTGIGMEPQQVETLFSMFNQADTNSNRRAEGVGLGLVISQKIIRQMRGVMTVKSEPGKGSEFRFVVPQQVLDATPIRPMEFGKGKSFRNKFIAPECKILAVDDNEMNLKVLVGLLAPYRVQVYTAKSGAEALKKMEELVFDFIFMDQMMPGMDGIETLHRIRKIPGDYHQHVPVVALTANAVGGAKEMFLAEGFQDYLTKPIDLSDLNRILKKHIPHYKKQEAPAETPAAPQAPAPAPHTALNDLLDTKTGVAYCGGNWQDYLDILDIYIDQGPENLTNLQQFYENQDWENYTILVHSLKSNSKGIGALALFEQAAELERCGKARDAAAIQALHGGMMADYRALLAQLTDERAQRKPEKAETEKPKKVKTEAKAEIKTEEKAENAAPAAEPAALPEITPEALAPLLENLREKLDAFESAEVDEALAALGRYNWQGTPLAAQLAAVVQKAQAFDYLGAGEALQQWQEGGNTPCN